MLLKDKTACWRNQKSHSGGSYTCVECKLYWKWRENTLVARNNIWFSMVEKKKKVGMLSLFIAMETELCPLLSPSAFRKQPG